MMQSLTQITLDEIDQQILEILQMNGHLSNVNIAKKINLSPPATHGRIKRLEQHGYIEGYRTILNREKIGYDMLCFVYVKADKQLTEDLEPLEMKIRSMDEVLECHHITGEYDYLLKVVIENTSGLKNFIRNKLSVIENISGIQTTISYEQIKNTTAMPIIK